MLIPQYLILVLKFSRIYTISLNKVFLNPQNQCYPGTPCIKLDAQSPGYDSASAINLSTLMKLVLAVIFFIFPSKITPRRPNF